MHSNIEKFIDGVLRDINKAIKKNPHLINVMKNLEKRIEHYRDLVYPQARLEHCPFYKKEKEVCVYREGRCSFLLRNRHCYYENVIFSLVEKYVLGNHNTEV